MFDLFLLVAVAALALAVVTLVQGRRGRLVFEPRDGRRRSPESIQAESIWAALEYAGGAVAIIGLVFNLMPVTLLGLALAGAGYVQVVRTRRRG